MPRKNSVKQFLENGYYHIYNRGVEKRIIFEDERDYRTFLYFLKSYLDPDEKIHIETGLPDLMNLSDEIDLLAYCLMPNHFHLLVHQKQKRSISKLLRRVCTNYVMYFNKRYKRVGPLFQGIYKACLIESDPYLLHVSRYIHRNPVSLIRVEPSLGFNPIASYPYSSYGDYVGIRSSTWVKPQNILEYFSTHKAPTSHSYRSYKQFVEDEEGDSRDQTILGDYCLDAD